MGVKADGYVTPPRYTQMTALRAENLRPNMDVTFDSTGPHKVLAVAPAPLGPKSVVVTLRGPHKEYVRTFRKTKMIGVPGLTPPD